MFSGLVFGLLLPVIASVLLGIGGRHLGQKGSLTVSLIILSYIFSVFFFAYYRMLIGEVYEVEVWHWIDVLYCFEIGILLDWLGLTMSLLILLISSCVILYSYEYMADDPHLCRFISYLFLFVFFMLNLVLANNFLQSFLGWEGVGIVSYLLVNFWFTRLEANRSALKAIIFNKIGDLGFLAAVVLMVFYFRNCNFQYVYGILSHFEQNCYQISIILSLLILGAMGKSAQLILHAWLPDAMEGPTPVSSLLHSATMVTAGIFILLRTSQVFNYSSVVVNLVVVIIGCLTCLMGATVAYFQSDIKKIIAYSTCSQLGFLFASIGMLNFSGCFFHLLSHAFFKALLFLTAGCVIHGMSGEQDIRKMGGIFCYMPLTAFYKLIAVFGLVGFPFIGGYYSKEHIILFLLANNNTIGNIIYYSLLFSSIFTILYSFKLLFHIFITEYNGYGEHLFYIQESGPKIIIAMTILFYGSLLFGYFYCNIFNIVNHEIWQELFPLSGRGYDHYIEIELFNPLVKNFLFLCLVFIFIIFVIMREYIILVYIAENVLHKFVRFSLIFFLNCWNFNCIYEQIVSGTIKVVNKVLYNFIVFVEWILLLKLPKVLNKSSDQIGNTLYSLNFYDNLFYIILVNIALLISLTFFNIELILLILFFLFILYE